MSLYDKCEEVTVVRGRRGSHPYTLLMGLLLLLRKARLKYVYKKAIEAIFEIRPTRRICAPCGCAFRRFVRTKPLTHFRHIIKIQNQ